MVFRNKLLTKVQDKINNIKFTLKIGYRILKNDLKEFKETKHDKKKLLRLHLIQFPCLRILLC